MCAPGSEPDQAAVAARAPTLEERMNRAYREGEHLHLRSRRNGSFGVHCPPGGCPEVQTRWVAADYDAGEADSG